MSGIGIVSTRYGLMRGVEEHGKYEGITTFKGVPYAAPPVGNRRWKPPELPDSWDGVRDCDHYAPANIFFCNQEPYVQDFYFEPDPQMSEDCLYLNIVTGATNPGERRPVYMWFHGGGLTNGFSYEVEFDGRELARKGVIVVSVAQRLGVFGYLALPQLTQEQGKSGNYGFMDQLMALTWVRENIASFGGDPNRITLGGQSGGSSKTQALAVSPCTKGMISGAILQSGFRLTGSLLTLQEAEESGRSYLRNIGVDPNADLETLRGISFDKLVGGADANRRALGFPGAMVKDDQLLPFDSLAQGSFAGADSDVTYMMGTNLGEASPYKEMDAAGFYAHFRSLLGDLYDSFDFEKIVQVSDKDPQLLYRQLSSLGLANTMGSRLLIADRCFGEYREKLLPGSKPVYTYLFSHILPCRPCDYGTNRDPEVLMAYHSSELFFTFASLREGVPPSRPWTELDFALADMISSYWANFIKTGNPNGEGLPAWPASGDDFGYMDLGDELLAHQGLDTIDLLAKAYLHQKYAFPEFTDQ